jgi:hypothetical protein
MGNIARIERASRLRTTILVIPASAIKAFLTIFSFDLISSIGTSYSTYHRPYFCLYILLISSLGIGGIALAYHSKEANATDTNTAISASTTVGDVKIAYTTIDIEAALSGMDGAISDTTSAVNVGDHNAVTLTTSVGGNTVTLKAIEIDGVRL